jgi:hypothetical protein
LFRFHIRAIVAPISPSRPLRFTNTGNYLIAYAPGGRGYARTPEPPRNGCDPPGTRVSPPCFSAAPRADGRMKYGVDTRRQSRLLISGKKLRPSYR